MPWMEPVSGRPPFLLRRGVLFQEGQRLTQLHHHGDIPRVPGSFWVEENATALLVHPLDSRNPEHCQFEITYQSQLLCPEQVGLDFIRLSGLRFEHCGNSFLRASAGAVSTRGGSHWIIEDCSFNQINSAGLEFSDYPFENKDPHPANPGHKWRGSGHVIVRRNTFSHCGTAGIRCLGVSEGRVLDNVVTDCGWQEAEYYYECAGIKLLLTRHTLVAGNRIRHLHGACGIWMDFNNQHSRVSANYISDIDSIQGGIFIEASLVENRIDHNVIWRIDGPGIFGGDSSRQIYEQNIIGHTTAVAMNLFCHTDRTVDGQPVACIENVVRHNLFVAVPGHRADEDNNIFQGNAYVHSHARDWSDWQNRGFDADAHYAIGQMRVDCESLCLRWELSDGDPIPQHIGALTLRGRQGEAQFA